MIYTVTCNPSLDYVLDVDDFAIGRTNRAREARIYPGGKGINVSAILRELGLSSVALGFIAGFTGDELEREIASLGIESRMIRCGGGMTRINVKLRPMEGTEVNAPGPAIGREQEEALFSQLGELRAGDVLFLSGSLPPSMPPDSYRRMMEAAPPGVLAIVDASGDALREALPMHPFLVKPNRDELAELFGEAPATRGEALSLAARLREMGARNALVSLAGDGAVLSAEDGGEYESAAPRGRLANGVGAGDSMVAGFVAGYLEGGDYLRAFRLGLAAGSASAFSEGLATRDMIDSVYRQICDMGAG